MAKTIPLQYPADEKAQGFNILLGCVLCRQRKKPFQMTVAVDAKERPLEGEYYCADHNEPVFANPAAKAKYIASRDCRKGK